MAASSHNTQPWRFKLGERSIAVLPDLSRRCPVVDPDDHHLFVSLGCATENLVHAALASGLHADALFDGHSVTVALDDTTPTQSLLSRAIPTRQCSRSTYDGRALSASDLRLLEAAGHGEAVHLILLTDKARMETVLDYVARGNVAQITDPAFVNELQTWIRFNDADAARTGDGLFSRSTGNPSVPRWLGRLLFGALLTPKAENDKCAEVPALRSQLATWLAIGDRRPNLVVRFGRGPEMPRSFRRPVEDVLV